MITPSDKIIRFAELKQLEAAIREDLTTRDVNAQRYCVRFIMLNDFNSFRLLTTFLCKELNVQMFEIQNLMLGEDKTVTSDRLSNAIKSITQSSLVTPFSELVRFYRQADFNGFFNEIILTEDLKNPGKRIYIPIIGLNNRFNDFLKNFGRIEESAPIWQFYAPKDDKVKVYVSRFKCPKLPDSSEFCALDTMRDWLDFWRKQAPREKILCSAYPIRIGWQNSRPDSIFTFSEITNPHEYITDFMGVNIPFECNESEFEYWELLQKAITEEGGSSFPWKKYIETHFNVQQFNLKIILEKWASSHTTGFDRWLLKNYLLHTETLKEKPYFKLCITETKDYRVAATLFVDISQRIFYASSQSEREKYCEERRDIMRQERNLFSTMVPLTDQDWILEHLIEIAQDDNGFPIVKKLATSTFDFEKELFIGWFQKRSDSDFGLSHIKEFYPDFHAYLSTCDQSVYRPGAEWLNDYFDKYRRAKVEDELTEDIRTYISTKNNSEATFWDWYYKHNTCHDLFHEIVKNEQSKPDKVYWIDGLGAEFIPFIIYLIETSATNYDVIHAEVATTGLPSNTSLNRFSVDNKYIFKFGELDSLAHDEHYKPRKTLISELDTIRRIIEKIIRDNSVGNHTIAIVSDHGLSALSRKQEAHKLTGKALHEGRYIPYTSDIAVESMPEYITITNPDDNKDYKVALTHASLGKRPSHEVHGGCTPEEVLVPFIVITNIDASKPIPYEIKNASTDVPKSAPVFECIIVPQPTSAELIVGTQRIPMMVKNTTWSATIPNAIEGNCIVGVQPFRGKIQNFDVKIYGLSMGASIMNDFDL